MNLCKAGKSQKDIALALDVSPATISRELKRNVFVFDYHFIYAQILAFCRRYFVKRKSKITSDIIETLKLHLAKKWTLECIANTVLKGKVCCQTLYNYVHKNAELRKLLFFKKRYRKRASVDNRGQILNRVSIEERPQIVSQYGRYGDFEGDLIVGKNHKGALLTLVERKSKYALAAKLESKNALQTGDAIIVSLGKLDAKTLTLDNGKEFANHEKVSLKLGTKVYFAHPYSSHERGLSENTNRLLRRYFPKKTDFRKVCKYEVEQAIKELNSRPRKCLNWKSPNDFLPELILNCAAP